MKGNLSFAKHVCLPSRGVALGAHTPSARALYVLLRGLCWLGHPRHFLRVGSVGSVKRACASTRHPPADRLTAGPAHSRRPREAPR